MGDMNEEQHGQISENKAVEDTSNAAQLSEDANNAATVAAIIIAFFVVGVVLLGLYCKQNKSSKYNKYKANKTFNHVRDEDDDEDLDEIEVDGDIETDMVSIVTPQEKNEENVTLDVVQRE